MKYNFDEVIDRTNYHSVKWDELESTFGAKDVLPMWIADMEFRSPKPVIEA
ncbi:MAG: cystathionine beta-lyase, partial [Thermodesulfobacteriota bacterium]